MTHISKEHLDAERAHIADRKQEAFAKLGPIYQLFEMFAFGLLQRAPRQARS